MGTQILCDEGEPHRVSGQTTVQIGGVLCASDVQGFHISSMGQVEYHFLNR